MSAYAAYYDSGREGDSWETAYIISSAEDLIALKDRVNDGEEPSGKYYVLTSDIDLTAEPDWESIGNYYNSFTGHFDGQDHTIMMNSGRNILFAALFYSVRDAESSEAIIKNISLTGTITADCAGTVVHYLYSGQIDKCSFSGMITPYS